MADTSDFRNGMALELDGQLFSIVGFQHVKPGKGGAFVRTKLKNVKTGAVIERTFRAGEKVAEARLERTSFQYLYREGNTYCFMDTETFDQISLSEEHVESEKGYLKENLKVVILMKEGEPVSFEIPTFVELAVRETDPGLRGDTASGGSKPATLETGLIIQVPLFIQVGDVVKVDTRSGGYVERVV
ncbi:MAG: elongation factor P [Candidatus Eisenbacteria bacterium]